MRRTIALGYQSARVSVSVALVGHTRERRAKSGCIHVHMHIEDKVAMSECIYFMTVYMNI